ncbi:hypothetical protein STENM223S_08251 [Streptomyces tendae]
MFQAPTPPASAPRRPHVPHAPHDRAPVHGLAHDRSTASDIAHRSKTAKPPQAPPKRPDPRTTLAGSAPYTDNGANGQATLTGTGHTALQPCTARPSTTTTPPASPPDKAGANGGKTVGDIHDDDWISFNPYASTGTTKLTARTSSAGSGGFLECAPAPPTGPLHGSAPVPPTGSWDTFQDVDVPLRGTPKKTDRTLPRLPGRRRRALRRRRLRALQAAGRQDRQARPGLLQDRRLPPRLHPGRRRRPEKGSSASPTYITVDSDRGRRPVHHRQPRPYDAVAFLSTTGDVLNADQQKAFENYVATGGGYVGIHAAADTEYDWEFYGGLVGAYFDSHPAIQPATVRVEDHDHPATAHLEETGSAPTSGTTTAPTPVTGQGPRHPGPDHLHRRQHEGRPPDRLVPDLQRRPLLLHRPRPHQGVVRRRGLPRPPVGGLRYATGQVKADCKPDKDYRPIFNGRPWTAGSRPAPASSPSGRRALHTEGGMGLLCYQAKELKPTRSSTGRWPGDDNSGVFVGFPASDDPWSRRPGLRDPDRRHRCRRPHHRRRLHLQGRDIKARDRVLRPPGQWNTYEIKVQGERLQVFLNGARSTTSPTRTRSGASPTATSASRTTGPTTRCPSATSN